MSRTGDLVLIGDVHIDRDDPALPEFLAFIDGLASTASRVVLLGDLFNVWIGGRGMQQPHQAAVIDRLVALRRAGVVVRYLEGNRDYRIGRYYSGTVFDDASDEGIVETVGGHSLYVTHGDLVNLEDRQYQTWRRFSRSWFVWALFRALPGKTRLRLVDRLERRMRETNLEYKCEFPEAQVRAFAARQSRAGHDHLVLGHFHVEKDFRADGVRVLVLPEWRESRRHLVVRANGELSFAG